RRAPPHHRSDGGREAEGGEAGSNAVDAARRRGFLSLAAVAFVAVGRTAASLVQPPAARPAAPLTRAVAPPDASVLPARRTPPAAPRASPGDPSPGRA